jgi:hypothetical protein
MRPFQPLCLIMLLVGTALIARADVVPDPDIIFDDDSLSNPIGVGSTFTPSVDGGGIFLFFNPNSTPITQVEFDVTLTSALTPGFGVSSFDGINCGGADFFSTCTITVPGAAPTEVIVEFFGQDSTHHGIPTLLPGCSSDPDGPGCSTVGHFAINLNNNDNPAGDVGGWETTTPFDTSVVVDAVPEPSTAILLVIGCALIFGSARRRFHLKHQ